MANRSSRERHEYETAHADLGETVRCDAARDEAGSDDHKISQQSEAYEDYLLPGKYEHKSHKGDDIVQLEITASVRNARAFERVLEGINWQNCSPAEHIRAIHLALGMGAYTAARHIAELGRQHYGNNEEIRKYATVLAPPTVTRKKVSFDPSIRANRDWIKAHGDEYRGKWVGLKNGELVGSADSLDDLMRLVGDGNGVLITRLY